MLGGALGQYPLGGGPTGTTTVADVSWYLPLSEPVRFKRAPRATIVLNYQVFTFNPVPFVSFGWFGNLSEPVRKKPRSPAALAPFGFFQPSPSPFVATGWYNWLSDPVRIKPGLKAAVQKFETMDTVFTPQPNTLFGGWYPPLTIPVRVKPRLRTGLQPDWTGPSRLLPTPNVTVTFSGTEINTDDATFVIKVLPYNPPASAAVSIVEIGTDGSATSIVEA